MKKSSNKPAYGVPKNKSNSMNSTGTKKMTSSRKDGAKRMAKPKR